MLNTHTLLPLIQKELPGVDPKEILAVIEHLGKQYPQMTNIMALMAFNKYMQQQKGGQQAPQPPAPQGQQKPGTPIDNMLNQKAGG
jgi:hypothetical protein